MWTEFAKLVDRQNHGNPGISLSERVFVCDKMQKLFDRYKNIYQKLDYLLNVFWDEAGVEEHFQSNLWYSSHRKLKHYESMLTDIHKQMFLLLTSTDGVDTPFRESEVWSPKEIYESCIQKYSKSRNAPK